MSDINNTITLSGNLDEAIRRRDELRTLNPNLVILMSYSYAAAHFNEFPEDSPYDRTGVLKPYHGLIDFTHPDIQGRIVQWGLSRYRNVVCMMVFSSIAGARCGLLSLASI